MMRKKLAKLKKVVIEFEDTVIGRLENVKKRELVATVGRLNIDERNKFRRLLNDANGVRGL